MRGTTASAAEGGRAEDEDDPAAQPPRVLIAVDDSPRARGTLASGLAQAATQGAAVTILHVIAPVRWRVSRMGPVRAVPMRVRDPLESPVLRDARRLAFEHGVVADLELIASDDVDGTILGVARRLGAASIVLGARRSAVRATPPRVCAGVLRRALIPVVIVPM